MKKKLLSIVATAVVLTVGLTGCGTKAKSSSDNKTIKVAASATPHAEILEEAKSLLKDKGYELEIKIFDDYILPNEVVQSGEFDANYFQHLPYLENYNKENKTNLVAAGKIHYEPFGIYPGTKTNLEDLTQGDVIAIPNDDSNEARALILLEGKGIIKLKDGAGFSATVNDIVENPKGIEIKEIEGAQIARMREEVAFVILNGNYALSASLAVTKDSIYYESVDSDAAKTYVNIIAVKEGNEELDKIKALVDVLKSDEIKQFINEKYDSSVIVYEE